MGGSVAWDTSGRTVNLDRLPAATVDLAELDPSMQTLLYSKRDDIGEWKYRLLDGHGGIWDVALVAAERCASCYDSLVEGFPVPGGPWSSRTAALAAALEVVQHHKVMVFGAA